MQSRSLALALVAAVLLTGCVTVNTDSGGDGAASDAASDHNAADVTFAQQMIPHHQQALLMADAAIEGAQTQELRDLAEQIKDAQAPEIEQMTSWLQEWDKDVPDLSGMNHMMMGHGDTDEGNDLPGMMDADQMQQMMQHMGGGRAFDVMWLQMMIAHHEGAIEMAQQEQASGQYPEAIALAERIEAAQTAEIEQMQLMLRNV